MQLFHYTSYYHLRGIGRFGLTVGDVPTDMRRHRGEIGVWLTSSPFPEGHGLGGSRVDKEAVRLCVEIPDPRSIHKWADWAPSHVTPETLAALRIEDAHKEDEFYIYFGWIPPVNISAVVDTRSGSPIHRWASLLPEAVSLPGIAYGKRHAWQKRMLGGVRNAMRRHLGDNECVR